MRFVFEASSRCVGVCFASYIYIYILSYGDIYIYIFIFVFGMVLFEYLGLHAFYNLDVHGFGFWKNKILFLVGASGVHIGCCLNPLGVSLLLFRCVWWLDCLPLKEGPSAFCSP